MNLGEKFERFKDQITEASQKDFCNLGYCNLNDAELAQVLPKLSGYKHLKELFFENCDLTDEGVRVIVEFCKNKPHISIINLSKNRKITDKGAILLLELTHVRVIGLYQNKLVTNKFAEAVLTTSHIREIDLRETSIDAENRVKIFHYIKAQIQSESLCQRDEVTEDANCVVVNRSM